MKKIRNENGLFGKKTMVMRWVFTLIVAALAITIFWMIEPGIFINYQTNFINSLGEITRTETVYRIPAFIAFIVWAYIIVFGGQVIILDRKNEL